MLLLKDNIQMKATNVGLFVGQIFWGFLGPKKQGERSLGIPLEITFSVFRMEE